MKISLDLFDPSSIDKAIQQLEDYSDGLEKKAGILCERLADIGYKVAFQIMGEHIYSGETISSLQVQEIDPIHYVLLAGSVALLFFEFGAGVGGAGHPLAGEFGMGPGTYPGQKHANDPNGWWFPTDDANLAIRTDEETGIMWAHSKGNPPYMPMYNASQQIRNDLLKTAQEVFKT